MRRTVLFLLIGSLVLAGLLLWAGSVAADLRPWPPRPLPPREWDGVVTLEVIVDGRPVPTVYHDGRTYLPVRRLGAAYQIRVRNDTTRRITAVVSVDGLSVISRRPASEGDPGYLVSPHDSILIEGWRRDRETVSAFRFEDREDSYAARTGHPEEIGVIGLVAFEEEGPRPLPRPVPYERDAAAAKAPAGVREGYRPDGDVGGTGTGSGPDVSSPTYEVPFVRGSRRHATTLYYDTVENLRRAGVPVDGYHPWPRPFPVDPR